MLHSMPTNTPTTNVREAALRVLNVDEKIKAAQELSEAGAAREEAHRKADESDRHYSEKYTQALKTGWTEAGLKDIGCPPAPQRPRGRPRGNSSKKPQPASPPGALTPAGPKRASAAPGLPVADPKRPDPTANPPDRTAQP